MASNEFGGRRSRFPAYDDKTGVKMNLDKQKRVLFNGNDDFLTDHSFTKEANGYLDQRRQRRQPTTKNDWQPKNSGMRRSESTDYHSSYSERRPLSTSRSTKRSSSVVNFSASGANHRTGTPFAPTHVPESLIPDEPLDAVSAKEIVQAMTKTTDSYLLFATDAQLAAMEEQEAREAQAAAEAIKNSRGKGHRLDKTLGGILEESTEALENSKYFSE